MMAPLAKVFGAIGAVLVTFMVTGLVLPGTCSAEASLEIDASPAAVWVARADSARAEWVRAEWVRIGERPIAERPIGEHYWARASSRPSPERVLAGVRARPAAGAHRRRRSECSIRPGEVERG